MKMTAVFQACFHSALDRTYICPVSLRTQPVSSSVLDTVGASKLKEKYWYKATKTVRVMVLLRIKKRHREHQLYKPHCFNQFPFCPFTTHCMFAGTLTQKSVSPVLYLQISGPACQPHRKCFQFCTTPWTLYIFVYTADSL